MCDGYGINSRCFKNFFCFKILRVNICFVVVCINLVIGISSNLVIVS